MSFMKLIWDIESIKDGDGRNGLSSVLLLNLEFVNKVSHCKDLYPVGHPGLEESLVHCHLTSIWHSGLILPEQFFKLP